MQIGSEATGGGDYVACFFSQYLILFANKTGSKIKKHVGVSTQGVVRPISGGYDPNPKMRVVTPAIGSNTPPSTYPDVFLILIYIYIYVYNCYQC